MTRRVLDAILLYLPNGSKLHNVLIVAAARNRR